MLLIEEELSVLDPLLVSFESGSVPSGVFDGLLKYFTKKGWIIECSDKCPTIKGMFRKSNKHHLLKNHRNHAVFSLEQESRTITFRDKVRYLQFFIHPTDSKDAAHDDVCYYKIYNIIKEAVKKVCENKMNTNDIKFGLNCNVHDDYVQDKHFAEVKKDFGLQLICSITNDTKHLEEKRSVWFGKSVISN